MVFRKTVGDAQIAEEVAFVENFCWAPHRYSSRSRPLARESRRWKVIFQSLAREAESPDPKRRVLASMFLGELGGENSSRVLLGGLLADLSVEHRKWVATGDEAYPDPTTAEERAQSFLTRIDTLFTQGMILTLPDTYTGLALDFLKDVTYYRYGGKVQRVGIGDYSDEIPRAVIQRTLRRVQVVVANMTEYMKLYRAKHSLAPRLYSLQVTLSVVCI